MSLASLVIEEVPATDGDDAAKLNVGAVAGVNGALRIGGDCQILDDQPDLAVDADRLGTAVQVRRGQGEQPFPAVGLHRALNRLGRQVKDYLGIGAPASDHCRAVGITAAPQCQAAFPNVPAR